MKPFDLVVYAIVAVAIIAVFFSYLSTISQPPTIVETIKTALNNAQLPSNLGTTIELGQKEIKEGTGITKSSFDSTNLSVAFECTSSTLCCDNSKICSRQVEWDFTQFRFKKLTNANFFVRCLYQEGFPVCRVYAGMAPAQIRINVKEHLVGTGSVTAIVETINDGQISMAPATVTPHLLKKVQNSWVDTLQEIDPKQTELIKPKEKQELLFEINVTSAGEYKLNFYGEGVNSGFDENGFEFRMGTNSNCVVDESRGIETILGENEGQYYELHYCLGCNFGYECASAWSTKTPGVKYEPQSSNQTYCVKNSENGSC